MEQKPGTKQLSPEPAWAWEPVSPINSICDLQGHCIMKAIGLDEIKWPALGFATPNSAMMYYDSGALLATASSNTLKRWRRLERDLLVDSSGALYHLEDPKFVNPPSFWDRLKGAKCQVKWHVRTDGVLSVDEIRDWVYEDFLEYESTWEAQNLDELKGRLDAAKSIEELMAVFAV